MQTSLQYSVRGDGFARCFAWIQRGERIFRARDRNRRARAHASFCLPIRRWTTRITARFARVREGFFTNVHIRKLSVSPKHIFKRTARSRFPPGNILHERSRAFKHTVHIYNLSHIPTVNALIKLGGEPKHIQHRLNLRNVPR